MTAEKIQKIYPEGKLKDVLGAFWQGIKPQKWSLFFCIFAIFSAGAVAVAAPVLYKQFFDIISSASDKSSAAPGLLKIIVEIAILHAVMWVFYRMASFIYIGFQTNVIARLKQNSYDYLIEHSYNFFTNNFAGSLVQKVNRFARAFETLTDRILWDILPLFTKIFFIVIIVSFINKWIALIIFIWVVVFLSFSFFFSRWKFKYDVLVAEIDSKTTGYLADTIANQNTIQLFSSQKFESQGYKNITSQQAKATKFSWNLDSVTDAMQSFLAFTIEFLLFYFTIKYWENGLATVGVFVMLQVYIINLIDNLWGFARIIRNIYQSYADAKEMVEILLLPHEIKDAPLAKELNINRGEIKFENLNFNFNETRSVLEDINLTIKPGEKVALIGPSGAGKTTFVRLLLRLYSPTSGRILIDGQDIAKATQKSLRENISMVPQDPILFHRTLAENIAYGKKDNKMSDIEAAAESAHCDDFIANLPYKFDTYVGERGIKLSGGERQRVAIARAILKAAPILVLDEATSSLDSHSEMLIQDALNNLMRNKTTIVIAHRLSTIQKMDRIIVIDKGKIVEQGSHYELLEKENSLYKKLWELQAGGFLKQENEEPASVPPERDFGEVKEDDNEKTSGEAKLANF
ncbi:MAG: ABC transporter ATP-binding protein [Patescibacteria group bacterium]